MPAPAGSRLVLAVLLFAALEAAHAQNTVLVLRRDWTPSTCSLPDVTCKEHPDSFSIFALYQADVASREPRTACAGKPPFATADLTAAGLALEDVGCAFQNYDPGTTSLEPVWQYHWDQYGACTPAATAASYFQQGLALDRRFPLPQDIGSGTTGAQLAAAIQAAYNATPVVACDAPDRLLRFVVLCFDPASSAIQDCPWPTEQGCLGPLRVPRTGRGAGFPACQAYYPPSPVSPLLAGSPAPIVLGAPRELVPLEASGSGSSSGGGTSAGAKVGALVGGIAGGMLLGAVVIGVSYRAYTRCAAGGSKGTAGSTSGPLLDPGSASDTPRQTLPLYSSRLPPVPE